MHLFKIKSIKKKPPTKLKTDYADIAATGTYATGKIQELNLLNSLPSKPLTQIQEMCG